MGNNDAVLQLGCPDFTGCYSRDTGVVFNVRPRGEWEYMATGTGRTGVAVMTHDQLLLQINADGSLDEHGWLQVVGRIRVTFAGDPLTQASARHTFRMVHDQRLSVIRIEADTEQGPLRIEIRAHMEWDVIRVDIDDERVTPGAIAVDVLAPWADHLSCQEDVATPGVLTIWHANGAETDWHEINIASGMRDDTGLADPLADRCFGMRVCVDEDTAWQARQLSLEGKRRTTIAIAAAAVCGEAQFLRTLADRFADRPDRERFRATHDAWWNRFWSHVWFRTDPSMMTHMAAYDFYRYYTAVASGVQREFPVRFQIELLRSTLRVDDSCWLQMHIHSVQSIEAYFPAYKNGDWECLASLVRFYRNALPFFQRFCAEYFGHEGATIPYTTNMWGSAHFCPAHDVVAPYVKRWRDWDLYHLDVQPWVQYSFEHGPAIIGLLLDAAQAKGDAAIITDVVLPYMREMCRFFLAHYPVVDGHIVFEPATSGETWFAARNPTSWIHLFQTWLPRAMALATEHGDAGLLDDARRLFALLPDVSLGHWALQEDDTGMRIVGEHDDTNVFLPAEVFHAAINAENPELYGLWPYRTLGLGLPHFEAAMRTYRGRAWQHLAHGWCLDVIWAARLGLVDEVLHDYDAYHFPATVRAPAGFSFETAPTWPEAPSLPLYPSMQGMGASVCHLYEMLCQDHRDAVRILPAWPADKPVSIAMYSANAGRVEIEYTPGTPPRVTCERPVAVILPDHLSAPAD